jgi:hypothetical protein
MSSKSSKITSPYFARPNSTKRSTPVSDKVNNEPSSNLNHNNVFILPNPPQITDFQHVSTFPSPHPTHPHLTTTPARLYPPPTHPLRPHNFLRHPRLPTTFLAQSRRRRIAQKPVRANGTLSSCHRCQWVCWRFHGRLAKSA